MSFSINGNNKGMVVPPEYYLNAANTRNAGASIVDTALGNDDYGFSVTDTVEMMVAAQMGIALPSLQSDITNANVQKGALSQFQMTMAMFSENTIKPLNQKNALTSFELTNSNPNAIKADISSDGTTGDLDLSVGVKQLAQSQSLKMGGWQSDEKLKAGSMTIDFGKYATDGTFNPNSEASSVTIEIKDGMTLDDVANEVNKASPDLKASVITKEDGTSELALISQKTGESHSMRVSTSGDPSLSKFNYNGSDTTSVMEARTASDAIYTVNGIEMTSPTNKIEDLFGVNLTLTEVTTSDVKISTAVAPEGVVDNVTAFVENFNSVMDMFNSFNEASPDENFVGSIHGTDIADTMQDELDKLFNTPNASGLGLSDIGVSKDANGKLSLNEDRLKSALEKDPEIAYKVLGSNHTSSHKGVDIIDSGDAINGEHTVIIDRKPEKAILEGSAITGDVTLAADKELKLKLGGKEVNINIPAGTHTPDEIAAMVNKGIQTSGVDGYSASIKNGKINIESRELGSINSIEVVADFPELGLKAEKKSGVDVSGTINGDRFLGDGAEFESKFDEASKGLKISFDPDTITLNQPITIGVSDGFLENVGSTFDTIKEDSGRAISEIKDALDPKKANSLVSQLEEMEKKEDYYYEFYYNQFSGISAQLNEMTSTMEMMDSMFGSDGD